MPIQFNCASCGQPIEVDDEHAGRVAACPYCQRVVNVPENSTLAPLAAPLARPATDGTDAGDSPRGLPPIPPLEQPDPITQMAAARGQIFGRNALVCAVLVVVMFSTSLLLAVPIVLKRLADTTSQPNAEELSRILSQSPQGPWYMASMCGATIFALVGTIYGLLSVRLCRRGNWRGWLSLLVCGALVAWTLLSIVLQSVLM
ncbi:MAG: hypothetical protein CHACPFDD_01264 [Phycisphaerae bacterium]|nr:hypothetical protein [Phycisphaerae bacterium]